VVSPHAYHANGTSARANLSSINLFWPSKGAHAHAGLPTPALPKSVVSPTPALDDDKYPHIKEENTMPQIVEPSSTDDEPEAQRAVIRLALDEIAAEVGTKLREASLNFPVYLTVSNSGTSLATIACPLDPSDTEWAHASAIVCKIIGLRLGNVRLLGRPLQCAVANATMGAAEVTADVRTEQ
jgi:hypothetical protein